MDEAGQTRDAHAVAVYLVYESGDLAGCLLFACIWIYRYTHIAFYTHKYTMSAFIHVCMYVCMYVCI